MQSAFEKIQQPIIEIDKIKTFKNNDLNDLCDAAQSAIADDSISFSIGLSPVDAKMRDKLEAYWKGALLIPERVLIVGRIDGVIASSIQLIKPFSNNHNSSFAATVDSHFVAPWARGYGLARVLLREAEKEAVYAGISLIKLSVRSNLHPAIKLYEACGYKRWGTLDKYEQIEGKLFSGYFYYKDL
jgi:ribosomal protein S18 acetylase RimI-like enzyme